MKNFQVKEIIDNIEGMKYGFSQRKATTAKGLQEALGPKSSFWKSN